MNADSSIRRAELQSFDPCFPPNTDPTSSQHNFFRRHFPSIAQGGVEPPFEGSQARSRHLAYRSLSISLPFIDIGAHLNSGSKD
ncbi:hypothetical protein Hypma_001583 [Hypsizygus marmoreus]|uniref:Uncharacterized protein n=1 Tax=Hypsizygus marmoreus TaxID=39966 RepID=A0A369JCP0_HYPMA|nr:hypothetical protein Hypma_001583 [Hypsizygus marmoreus]